MANIARLQKDMDEAKKAVGGAMDFIKKSAGFAMGALAALGVGLSVSAFTGWIRGAINAADALDEMSGRVGVSAKELSGLQLAYRQAGMQNDAMASSIAKLSKEMSEGNVAFRALGVSAHNTDGTMKSTTAVLFELADQFKDLPDGAAKTALAMEIFGKSGAEMVPLLSSGSDGIKELIATSERLGTVLEDSTAAQAGQFNDTLELLQLGVSGVGTRVASELLPTLTNLTGSFLESMTQGDALKNTAAALASGLKLLYSAGVGVVGVFQALGTSAGAGIAAIQAALSGNFSEAKSILSMAKADITSGWQATAASISKAWNTEADASVAAAAKGLGAQRDLLAAQKAKEEAAKKAASAGETEFQKAAKQIRERIDLADQELKAGRALTDEERFAAKIANELAAAKVPVTAAERAQIKAMLERSAAARLALDIDKALTKAAHDLADARQAQRKAEDDAVASFVRSTEEGYAAATASAKQRIQDIEDEVKAAKLSATANVSMAQAVEMVAIARLKEKQTGFYDGSEGFLALQREIDLRQQLVQNMGLRDTVTSGIAEWQKLTDSVYNGLTDSLFRAFEAGDGFFSSFWTGIKNTLKTTVLKVAIQGVVGLTGTALATGANAALTAAGGSSSGGIVGAASNVASLYSAGSAVYGGASSFGFGLSSGFGATLSGSTAGAVASGAANVAGAGGASAAAGAGEIIGALGPYAVAALVVANALGLFRSKTVNDSGIVGTLTAGGGDLQAYTETRRGGTLFSGPSYSTAYSALDAGQTKAIGDAVTSIYASARQFGGALGYVSDTIDGYTQAIDVSTRGLSAEKYAEALGLEFTALANNLANRIVPGIAQFAKEGEISNATLARLGSSLMQVNDLFQQTHLRTLELTAASGDAANKFLDLFGGIENARSAAQGYYDAIVTESQKADDRARQVLALIGAAGFNGNTLQTAEAMRLEYQRITEAQDVTTESGRQMRAQLMLGAGQFAAYADALGETAAATTDATATITEAASNAARLQSLNAVLTVAQQTASSAMATVSRAVAAERARIEADYAIAQAAAQARVDSIAESVSRLSAAASKLRGVVDGFWTDATLGMSRADASAQIAQALAQARAGGSPDIDALGNALSVASKFDQAQYESFIDYARDFAGQAATISELAELTDGQLSVEQRALEAAREQLLVLKDGRDQSIRALDAQLAAAQAQLDALNGISASVLTIPEALRTLAASIAAAVAAQNAVKQAGGKGSVGASGFSGQEIRDYINTNTSNANGSLAQETAIYNAAIANGVNSAELAAAMGWTQQTVLNWAASQGLPAFDTGIDRVPYDMVARIHEGEAIVPKRFNPWSGGDMGQGAMQMLAERLLAEFGGLRGDVKAQTAETGKVAAVLQRVERPDGLAIANDTTEVTQ